MKKVILALFLCMMPFTISGLKAQNIQLHYDFGRSLYDKDLRSSAVYFHCRKIPSGHMGKYLFFR